MKHDKCHCIEGLYVVYLFFVNDTIMSIIRLIIEIVSIHIVIVYIIDISGVVDAIKKRAFKMMFGRIKYFDYRIKPFDCSSCMCFWLTLFFFNWYISDFFIVSLLVSCISSYFAIPTGNFIKKQIFKLM